MEWSKIQAVSQITASLVMGRSGLITLSNNVNLNAGPHIQNMFFNIISGNINSLAKDNFQRVRLIEGHI